MDSSTDPTGLVPGYYSRGMNVTNRGGIIQCRPGYRCLLALPAGRLQGFSVFRPKRGVETLVLGVEGQLYTSQAPFDTATALPGGVYSATAQQLFFKQVEQSVELNPDGSLTFINPKSILVIQDGGSTSPILFDGTSATYSQGSGSVPLGGSMEWVADRLWVARGTALYASDIGNPVSFTESLYIAGVGFFIFAQEITALARTLAVDNAQLLVFTRTTTSQLLASIRDRSTWPTTPNFQKEVFPKIGCVSQRSVRAHYGLLWWYCEQGLISLDAAASGYITSTLPYVDAPMQDSKGRVSQETWGVACCSFENYFLCSVPYADVFNRHTWCLDFTVDPGRTQQKPAFNSFWTGTRPVEWLTGEFDSQSRAFYISVDYDGVNRLWEAFMPDRLDNGCPITWWAESRAYSFESPGKFKQFRYADIFQTELSGVFDCAVFWAGSHKGKYKRVMTKRILANTDTFIHDHEILPGQELAGLKKQSRYLRTQDGKAIIAEETLSACAVESERLDFVDDSFQILVVGSGPGAIRGIIGYAEPPVNEDDSGRCEQDETENNYVRFDGGASSKDSLDAALAEFSDEIPVFNSSRTVSLTQDGLTGIGSGTGSSIISQQDADKIATAMANRLAAEQLKLVLPQFISLESTQ